jgi:hypothetical protein
MMWKKPSNMDMSQRIRGMVWTLNPDFNPRRIIGMVQAPILDYILFIFLPNAQIPSCKKMTPHPAPRATFGFPD